MTRADAEEMDRLSVDLGQELGVLVQFSFGGTPVVAVSPVADQLLKVRGRDAATPVLHQVVRPAGLGQTAMQVLELRLRHVDLERTDLAAHAECLPLRTDSECSGRLALRR